MNVDDPGQQEDSYVEPVVGALGVFQSTTRVQPSASGAPTSDEATEAEKQIRLAKVLQWKEEKEAAILIRIKTIETGGIFSQIRLN